MATEFWNESDLISKFLDDLVKVIDHLPYPAGIRSALKYNVITDFFESWQFDDQLNKYSITVYKARNSDADFPDVVFTEGIKNFHQVNRYAFEFTRMLKHVRQARLEEMFFPIEPYQINENKKKKGLNYSDIVKQTYLNRTNVIISTDKEFYDQFYKICGNKYFDQVQEIKRAKEGRRPNPFDLNKIILDQVYLKTYAIDELEYMICIEAVDHFYFIINHNLQFDYDLNYFDRYISGPLKIRFKDNLIEKLTSIDDFDAVFYLHNSINQFISHAPDLRYQELYDKFWKAFIFPNDVNHDGGPAFVKFMDRVLAAYEKHFFKYESIIEDIYAEYKRKSPEIVSGFERDADTINDESDNAYHEQPIYFKNPESGRMEKLTINTDEAKTANIKYRSTIQPHAFTYKNNPRNSDAVADLFDSLQKNGFISSNADKRDFRRIFENTSPKVPIPWAGALSELSYLIKQIHYGEELIENLGNNIWKVTGKIFCDSDGNYYDWKRFKGQKKPARAALLDKAVALLK